MVLLTRTSSQWICGFGLSQLFFATGLVVCGFIVMGLYHNISCIGIWLGLPMMAPGLLGVVALGTRHRKVAVIIFFTSVIVMAMGVYHAVKVYDDIEFWEKYRKYAETVKSPPLCYDRGDHCSCMDKKDYFKSGYRVQFCDQFRIGEELFWTMIALTIGGIFFSLINSILCVWAAFTGHPREEFVDLDEKLNPPEYNLHGSRNTYQVKK